ncbi:lysis system i-spanin subunit Rz [Yersinia ruckeri]|uniref:lysis system i-spanin subunit Rz n=1 Tax=Yersinia ruckeri TaxID=29486 RepID=UPI0004E2AAB9|nr:lysis system i-spanin subunit Rz [Yersinia ruckeri]ARZ00528.1 phage endopeptidase [Yersinia ruckeri]EKN4689027.1 lysis protein [Yersinia ruckeri]KFE37485.1 gp54 [Yersinia ruckeri]MCK8585268.1 lysis protein [Yersinia ruckeri]MCW6524282.1 lysis protein [Yersinia ruckeri]
MNGLTLLLRYWRAMAVISLMAVSFCSAWLIQGVRWDAAVASFNQKIADEQLRFSEANQRALQVALSKQQAAERANAANDNQYRQEREHAQVNINQLRNDVADGQRRLRIALQPKADHHTLSASSCPASLADVNPARLTDAAERDYFTLLERMAQANSQILGLQGYINDVCLSSR